MIASIQFSVITCLPIIIIMEKVGIGKDKNNFHDSNSYNNDTDNEDDEGKEVERANEDNK